MMATRANHGIDRADRASPTGSGAGRSWVMAWEARPQGAIVAMRILHTAPNMDRLRASSRGQALAGHLGQDVREGVDVSGPREYLCRGPEALELRVHDPPAIEAM